MGPWEKTEQGMACEQKLNALLISNWLAWGFPNGCARNNQT